nr:hypothetical protein [Candidatus Gracilibacteria bacterium]
MGSQNNSENFQNNNEPGFLSEMYPHLGKVVGITGLVSLLSVGILINKGGDNDVNNSESITLPDNGATSGKITIGEVISKEKDDGFKIAKVIKKGIGVLEFMKENGMEGDWKNLVNKRTGKRIENPRTDLILGETYILARDTQEALRLAFLIDHKNERVILVDKGDDSIGNQEKIETKDNGSNKTKKSIIVQSPLPPILHNDNEKKSLTFSYKDYIEGKLTEAVIPKVSQEIEGIFKNGSEKGSSIDLLRMASTVESSNGKFLASYIKAVNAGNSKERAVYIERALKDIIAGNNDVGVFQITPIWIKEEIQKGAKVDGHILTNLSTLKSKVRSVLINSSIKGLSSDELLNKLADVDVRFDIVKMGTLIQNWFIRTSKHYDGYNNLTNREKFIITHSSYNIGITTADRIAREVRNGNLAEIFKKYGVKDIYKRLKQIALSTQGNNELQNFSRVSFETARHNPVIVAQANFETRIKIASIISRDPTIFGKVKESLINMLKDDPKLEKISRSIDYYEIKAKNGSPKEIEVATIILYKLKKIKYNFNKMNNEAILRIANEGFVDLEKAA